MYHWRELPQEPFLSRQNFCRYKYASARTNTSQKLICLLRQNYVCYFVATKLLSWQIFVATNTCLSNQKFCHNKHTFVMTKDVFCHDKHVLVMTKVSLSRQKVCRDKRVCCNKYLSSFVTTSIHLSQQKPYAFVMTKLLLWQKWYLWQLLPMTRMKLNELSWQESETEPLVVGVAGKAIFQPNPSWPLCCPTTELLRPLKLLPACLYNRTLPSKCQSCEDNGKALHFTSKYKSRPPYLPYPPMAKAVSKCA